MSFKKCFILLLCLHLILECNAQTKPVSTPKFSTAIEYNDYIVTRQIVVTRFFAMYSQIVNDTNSTQAEADIYCATISRSIGTFVAEINAMPAWDGDTAFRNCSVRLFKFYQGLFDGDFLAMNKLIYKPDFSDSDKAEVRRIFHSSDDLESQLDTKYLEMQIAFAEKNGFSLKQPPKTD